jgi:hypothetical protein
MKFFQVIYPDFMTTQIIIAKMGVNIAAEKAENMIYPVKNMDNALNYRVVIDKMQLVKHQSIIMTNKDTLNMEKSNGRIKRKKIRTKQKCRA